MSMAGSLSATLPEWAMRSMRTRSRRPCCDSTPQPESFRVVQRLQANARGAQLTEDIHLKLLPLARQRGRDVAGCKAPADAVPECRGGHVSDRRAVLQDRFVPDRLGVGARELEDHEATLRPRGTLREGGSATREVGFVEIDVALQAGLSRRVVRPEILV